MAYVTPIVSHEGGKFKKWEDCSARVLKCDASSVSKRDEFVGHATVNSDFVSHNSNMESSNKPSCACRYYNAASYCHAE